MPITPVYRQRTLYMRYLACLSFIVLISWTLIWQLWLSPHLHIKAIAVTIVWVVPLMFPLAGILSGKPYTHAWANFILMIYILHGITIFYLNNGERYLAAIELAIVSISFVSNILFARYRGQELGLKLEKLSEVERREKQKYS